MNVHINTLTIGMKINIEIEDDLDGNKKNIYPSQILDILETDELVIRGPIKNAKFIFLDASSKLHISYNILDKGKHSFEAKVLSRKYANLYTLTIKKISPIKNVQNREYFRITTTISVIKEFKKNISDENIYIEECETKDISGGGMRLYTNHKHETGDSIVCSFIILNHKISINCKIVRVEEVDSFNYKYVLGLAFLNIPEDYRDIIIRYIFNQQRKLRSKGLI